jgi:thiaminase/transcriptional activator TenA
VQAWSLAGPLPEPYREFAERWGNAEFTKYVDALQCQADEALLASSQVLLFSKRAVSV